MAAEEILQLFDSYWLEHNIFKAKPIPTKPIPDQEHHLLEESKVSNIVNLQVRSVSDQSLRIDSSCFSQSPRSVITTTSKLQKILSGQETNDFCKEIEDQEQEKKMENNNKQRRRRIRRRSNMSRSLSDLEFEELKGFMDLGFIFTEEDKKSSLVSIIPGLQRWGKRDEDEIKGKYEEVSRPYLSEAWKVLDEQRNNKAFMMMEWRFPALHNEINMKDNLKAWAHIVASTVR
ncbi:hypothetical protein M9H77_21236 [Catharanthus roseus]|uniref:Uncharacterized protein n=1 Tax=Catharanthus roseus TaxID=4058 RepID=A0ACC0AR36_CATRO|nr:hypothetical protein M9H77_21236 [Catharanthus roseus]